jgi:hypothetical protein
MAATLVAVARPLGRVMNQSFTDTPYAAQHAHPDSYNGKKAERYLRGASYSQDSAYLEKWCTSDDEADAACKRTQIVGRLHRAAPPNGTLDCARTVS